MTTDYAANAPGARIANTETPLAPAAARALVRLSTEQAVVRTRLAMARDDAERAVLNRSLGRIGKDIARIRSGDWTDPFTGPRAVPTDVDDEAW